MLLERLKSAELLGALSKNLISGISIYIDDMRMLKNIYNEYVIYHDKLSTIGLVQDKLFSLIVYKNLFPSEFSELQYGKGQIPLIFQRKRGEVLKLKDELNAKIDDLERDLKTSENEHLKSIKELRTLYLAEFLKRISSKSPAAIYLKGEFVVFDDVLSDDWFNLFKNSDNIQYKGQGPNPFNSGITFQQLENDLGHHEDYEMRLKSLHLKNDGEKHSVRTEIIKTKGEIDSLERLDLSEILSQENKIKILGSDLKNEKILFFLFSNGYIAENFQPYVSYFYEGPVTQNDYKFILSVNERRPLESDFQINNHQEVIERLRSEDFSGKEILNFGLLNFLLKNQSKFSNQLKPLIAQLSNESVESVEFVKSFIKEKQNELEKFSELILSSWKSIWQYQEERKTGDETKKLFLDLILNYSSVEQIEEINSVSRLRLSSYISNQESFIKDYEHSEYLESIMELIRKIKVKFKSVIVDDSKSKLFSYILKFQLYELNRGMIRVILNNSIPPIEYDDEKFHLSNYTLIQNSGLELLKSYVNQEINDYVRNVIIDFDEEINEQEKSFIELLNHENLNNDYKIQLIEKQRDRVSNLSEVNEDLWTSLFSNHCIEANWKNVIEYYLLNNEEINEELREYFNDISNANELGSKYIFSNLLDKSKRSKFCRTLVLDNEILNNSYKLILNSILFSYGDISSFDFDPETFEKEKIQLLIDTKTITLTVKNFSFLKKNYFPLHLKLIIKNRKAFYEKIDDLNLEVDDINRLLREPGLVTGSKKKIIRAINFDNYKLTKELANIMLDIYSKNKLSITYSLLLKIFSLTTNSAKQISLLTKNIFYLKIEQLEAVISKMPNPYNKIAIKGKKPKIIKSSQNTRFVAFLETKKFISSYKVFTNKIQIFTHRK